MDRNCRCEGSGSEWPHTALKPSDCPLVGLPLEIGLRASTRNGGRSAGTVDVAMAPAASLGSGACQDCLILPASRNGRVLAWTATGAVTCTGTDAPIAVKQLVGTL